MAYEQGGKDGDRHGVGRMAGKEAILPAAVVVDDIDHGHQHRVVRRAWPRHKGLEQPRGGLVGDEYAETQGKDGQQYLTHLAMTDDNIKQHQGGGNPCHG